MPAEDRVEGLIDKGTLTAAGYSGDTYECAKGEPYGNIFKIVAGGAVQY